MAEAILTGLGMSSGLAGVAGPVLSMFGEKALSGLLGGGGSGGVNMPPAPVAQSYTTQVKPPAMGAPVSQSSTGGSFGIPGAGQPYAQPQSANIMNTGGGGQQASPFSFTNSGADRGNAMLNVVKSALPGVSESMLKDLISCTASGSSCPSPLEAIYDVTPSSIDKNLNWFEDNWFAPKDYLDQMIKSMLGG